MNTITVIMSMKIQKNPHIKLLEAKTSEENSNLHKLIIAAIKKKLHNK